MFRNSIIFILLTTVGLLVASHMKMFKEQRVKAYKIRQIVTETGHASVRASSTSNYTDALAIVNENMGKINTLVDIYGEDTVQSACGRSVESITDVLLLQEKSIWKHIAPHVKNHPLNEIIHGQNK